MDADMVTVVTGGAGGEGIQLWDLRKSSMPMIKLNYA